MDERSSELGCCSDKIVGPMSGLDECGVGWVGRRSGVKSGVRVVVLGGRLSIGLGRMSWERCVCARDRADV